MAANWFKFTSDLTDFLASKSSSGPEETGSRIADIYLAAIRTAQTPTGNIFGFAPGSEALRLAWGQAFSRLSKSNTPTAKEKLEDPKFSPEPERPLPGSTGASEAFLGEFKDYLRKNRPYRFTFFESEPVPSEFVLETDNRKLGAIVITEKDVELYDKEYLIFEELKQEFIKDQANEQQNDTKSQEPDEKDPYDEMALALVAFWSLSGPIVFSPLPPIPPATEPVPGTYLVTFPGNPWVLSNSLRRAFNLGLREEFKFDLTGRESGLAISNALALAFATHLFSLKFVYSGTAAGTPVVSIVSSVF